MIHLCPSNGFFWVQSVVENHNLKIHFYSWILLVNNVSLCHSHSLQTAMHFSLNLKSELETWLYLNKVDNVRKKKRKCCSQDHRDNSQPPTQAKTQSGRGNLVPLGARWVTPGRGASHAARPSHLLSQQTARRRHPPGRQPPSSRHTGMTERQTNGN